MVWVRGLYRPTNAKRCLKFPGGKWPEMGEVSGVPSNIPDTIPLSIVWHNSCLLWEEQEKPHIYIKE